MKKVISYILSFILIILIVLACLLTIMKSTILNEEYVISKLEEARYYDRMNGEIIEQFKNYTIQSGLSDEVLDDIKFISSLAFKLAEQKVNSRDVNGENMQNTLDEGTANKYIEALNTYLSQVQDFNKQVAEYFVSEGIVDLQFASGITSNMSLRIGRIIK